MTLLPRIPDPQAVPVIGTDTHLPPLAAELLSPEQLRQRFATPPVWEPEFPGDALVEPRDPAAASVLVPLVMHAGGLRVLLTQRGPHLRDHAGQVSFPGGRAEPYDAGVVDTALREAEEEVGLSRQFVDVIGCLPLYSTNSNFQITPVVALVRPAFELTLDAFEVAEAFEVPLAHLMNPAHHRRHLFEMDGARREFISMPWQGPGLDGVPRHFFIWGATAAMLRNLYRFLAA